MSIRRASDDARRRLLGELLSDDWEPGERRGRELAPTEIDRKISEEGNLPTIAGGSLDEDPEFRQHECWRMLHVWPDEVDHTLPGRLECPGCGATFRAELEYRP
jgi:hypothetical protein